MKHEIQNTRETLREFKNFCRVYDAEITATTAIIASMLIIAITLNMAG